MGKIVFYKLFTLLRERDITQKELRENGIVSFGTLDRLRQNESITTGNLSRICDYLNCDIGDICEHRKDDDSEKRPQGS